MSSAFSQQNLFHVFAFQLSLACFPSVWQEALNVFGSHDLAVSRCLRICFPISSARFGRSNNFCLSTVVYGLLCIACLCIVFHWSPSCVQFGSGCLWSHDSVADSPLIAVVSCPTVRCVSDSCCKSRWNCFPLGPSEWTENDTYWNCAPTLDVYTTIVL